MQYILQSRYHNIHEREAGKYLVQTRSQARSSGITLPEILGKGEGLDPNIRPER